MKYTIYLILVLALASLACLETNIKSDGTSAPAAVPAASIEPTQEPDSGAVFMIISPEPARPTCATVTAIQALHLRAEPSEKARVIGYLHHGQAVMVQLKESDWWLINTGTLTGYARSAYLQESECK